MVTVLLIWVAIITVISILANPMIGFIIIILLIPVATFPSLMPSFLNTIQSITPIKIVGGLTVISALIHIVLDVDKKDLGIFLSPQAVIFIIYLTYVVMNGFLQPGANTRGLFTVYMSFAMFFFLTTDLVNSVKRFRIAVWSCILAVSWTSFVALFQYIKWEGYDVIRPGGMFGDPNYFAISLLIALAFACYRISGEKLIRAKLLAVGAFGILFTSLILTLSRGGMLGFLAGFSKAISKIPRKSVGVITLILGIGIISLIMPKEFWHRMDVAKQEVELQYESIDVSTETRIMLTKAGWRMFLSKPVFGVGPGNFYWRASEFAEVWPGMAHNMYIEILAELGIVGFLLFIRLIHLTLKDLRSIIKKAEQIQEPELLNFAISIQVGLTGFLISAIFLHAEYEKIFWLSIFLTICLKKLSERKGIV